MLHREPAQHDFKIGQRQAIGHWQDFETLRRELQPFLHPIPETHHGNDGPCPQQLQHCRTTGFQQQAFSKGHCLPSSSRQGCWKMVTQQELMAAGRMDLLHAVRLWGGFTHVADRLGVLPNTRYIAKLITVLPSFCPYGLSCSMYVPLAQHLVHSWTEVA